ncbi:MAG: hypothetical protein WBP59_04040 [Ilumatobacteraceae bacterium]
MSVQAWFSNDEVSLAPGSTLTLPLTVHNLGESTESYTIVPAGLTASWTSVSRGNLTLFGGSQEVVDITVTPPELPTTSSGPTAISIRVIPLGDSDDAVVAEATVSIEEFDDCRLVPLQSVQRARHRATYEFMVENHGNTVASCRLHLVDTSNRVDGDFDPPAVGVAPGGASLVRLKARASRGVFRRATRTLDFEVEAGRQGHPPVATDMALVQSPTIPGVAIARAAAVAALLGGLVAAWFGVVEPTIEDAVNTEIDQRVSEFAVSSASTPNGAPTTTAVTDAGTTDVETTPGFFRLSVAAPLTQTADQSTTMVDGEVFEMTDLRIENPFNDKGVATLLVNTEPVFIWGLDNVRGSYFEPRITPIRLQPGDNVTFSVKCDEIGDATRSTCTNAVNVGGQILPADD